MVICDDTGADLAGRGDGRARPPRSSPGTTNVLLRGGALGPGDGRPAPPGGTSCSARRPSGGSAASTRSCRLVALERAVALLRRARRRRRSTRGCSTSTTSAPLDPVTHHRGPAGPGGRRRLPADAGGRAAHRRSAARSAARAPRSTVTPPTWRPDLLAPADLVEEVIRLDGYDKVPSALPIAPPGNGLTPGQRRRRTVGRALAEAGYVEVLLLPVRVGRRRRRARTAGRRPAARRGAAGQPALGAGAAAADHRCCRRCSPRCAATSAAGRGMSPCSSRAWCSCPAGRRRRRRRWGCDRRPTDERVRRGRRDRAGPAVARRGGAGRRARAVRLVGGRPVRRLGRRGRRRRRVRGRRGRGRARPYGPAAHRAVAPGPVRGARGRRARSSGTPASCIRPSAQALELPRRTCAMELNLDAVPLPGVVAGTGGCRPSRRR